MDFIVWWRDDGVSDTGGGSRERRQGKYAGGRTSRGGFDAGVGAVGGWGEEDIKKTPRVSVRTAEIEDGGGEGLFQKYPEFSFESELPRRQGIPRVWNLERIWAGDAVWGPGAM